MSAKKKLSEGEALAHWQGLMRRWDEACAEYAAAAGVPFGHADDREPSPDDAPERKAAHRNVVEIKQEIDRFVAARRRGRRPMRDTFRLAILEKMGSGER